MLRTLVLVAVTAVPACDVEADPDACDPGMHDLGVQSIDYFFEDFVDSNDYDVAPPQTAVGGLQRFAVGVFDGCGAPQAPSPVTVTDDSPAIATATVESDGTTIDLHALASGMAELHVIAANGLVTEGLLGAEPIDHVKLVARELGEPTAFLRGTQLAAIVLIGSDGQPVIDSGVEIFGDLANDGRWNEIAIGDAPAGDHALAVLAGVSTWPVMLRVVDHIDAVVAQTPTLAVPSYSSGEVCFSATSGGDIVGGAAWLIDYPSTGGLNQGRANCVTVFQGNGVPSTITVTGRAAGFSAVTTVTFTN